MPTGTGYRGRGLKISSSLRLCRGVTSSPAFLRDECRAIAAGADVELVLVSVLSDREDQRVRIGSDSRRATDAEAPVKIDGADSRSQAAVEALSEQVRFRTGSIRAAASRLGSDGRRTDRIASRSGSPPSGWKGRQSAATDRTVVAMYRS